MPTRNFATSFGQTRFLKFNKLPSRLKHWRPPDGFSRVTRNWLLSNSEPNNRHQDLEQGGCERKLIVRDGRRNKTTSPSAKR